MARIRRIVKVELADEEKETLRKASRILDELADEEGAVELYEIMDNYDNGLYYFSCALDNLVENSN